MSNMKQGAKEGLGVQDKKQNFLWDMFGKKKGNIPQDKLSWVPKHDFFCFRDDLKCDPGQFID